MLVLEKWPAEIEELKYLRAAIAANNTARIKAECEYLIEKNQLMPPIRMKVSDLLDQLYIEADLQAKEITHSNSNNNNNKYTYEV